MSKTGVRGLAARSCRVRFSAESRSLAEEPLLKRSSRGEDSEEVDHAGRGRRGGWCHSGFRVLGSVQPSCETRDSRSFCGLNVGVGASVGVSVSVFEGEEESRGGGLDFSSDSGSDSAGGTEEGGGAEDVVTLGIIAGRRAERDMQR